MFYKVFIPSAGIGSRLGDISKDLNKALVPVGNKAVISHVIEKFPLDVPIVVALGYKGDLVREYLTLAHPDRTFEYVFVSPFEGQGSGLGHTLLSCKDKLMCPFVFCSNDTIVEDEIPAPDKNWLGFSGDKIDSPSEYRTISTLTGNSVDAIHDKTERTFGVFPYIGLAGINDYERFWKLLESGRGYGAVSMGECYALKGMLTRGVAAIKFAWHDTGDLRALQKARARFDDKSHGTILPKDREAIYFVNGRTIKYFADFLINSKRIERGRALAPYTPPIIGETANMHAYAFVPGKVLSSCVNPAIFTDLLGQLKEFWKPEAIQFWGRREFSDLCSEFYCDKTEGRVRQYLGKYPEPRFSSTKINGECVPDVNAILGKIDWGDLNNGIQVRSHLDLHFDNIILSEDGKFVLIDWRHEFTPDAPNGDIYYEFGKLLHNMVVSHREVERGNYKYERNDDVVTIDILRPQVLVDCEEAFWAFVRENGYSEKKVKIICGLIYLNIATLYPEPYNHFLWNLGKYRLWMAVK